MQISPKRHVKEVANRPRRKKDDKTGFILDTSPGDRVKCPGWMAFRGGLSGNIRHPPAPGVTQQEAISCLPARAMRGLRLGFALILKLSLVRYAPRLALCLLQTCLTGVCLCVNDPVGGTAGWLHRRMHER